MKRNSLVTALSGIIFTLSSVIALGWIFRLQWLVMLIPDCYAMVFNVSLCFSLAGLALLFRNNRFIPHNLSFSIIGSCIFLISALTLSQNIFKYSIGIDDFFVTDWFPGRNSFPGRMATNSALAFFFASISFILLNNAKNRISAIVLQLSIFFVFAIGFTALLGYLLDIEFLFRWHSYTRMAFITATTFGMLSVTLWLTWKESDLYEKFYENRDDKKILFLSTIILTWVAVTAGLLGFVILAKQEESATQRFLQETLKDKVDNIQNLIFRAISEMSMLEHPDILKKIIMSNKKDNDYEFLSKILLNTTFSSIQIENQKNEILYSAGKAISHPEGKILMNLPFQANIVWENDFYIELLGKVTIDNSKHFIRLYWPIDEVLKNTIGSQNEVDKQFYFCNLSVGKKIYCLPNLGSEHSINNILPNKLESELISAIKNYRNIVIRSYGQEKMLLAYQPIGHLGIGLVVKTDLAKFYQPLLSRLAIVMLILAFIISIGVLLLYWLVAPLVTKVKDSETRFKLAFDSSAIGMALVSFDGSWLSVNNALCEILGYTEEKLKEIKFEKIIYSEDSGSVLSLLNEAKTGSIENFRLEKRFWSKDNRVIWVLLNATIIRNTKEIPAYFICQIQDVTKQKEYEAKLNFQAKHDVLTGLVNRVELDEQLNKIILHAQRTQQKFSVFFLDLDNFKQVNDSLGHDAGDRLLKIIADRLKGCVRKCDVVSRLGGDEFVLVLTDLHKYESAAIFADRIINVMLSPIKIKGHEVYVTSSIGISFYPTDGLDAVTLIRNADNALYQAKKLGRNNYQFCESNVSAKIREKMTFEADLKKAIDHEEFKMYYLPQIDPTYNSVVGVEGLLRWQSDQYGLVTPQDILPVAEETGLIIPLSEWVIKTACQQVIKWQNEKFKHLHLSINISARHYMHERVIDSIIDNMKLSNFDATYLMLEINENLIMQDPDKTIEIINVLKRYGIKIIIDNFGTGYSSFTYLQDFSVDGIKIDRSLVKELTINSKRAELVQAMITFAKNLKIKVIAEGIETKEQFEFLVNAGCDELQGYYICKPMLANEITEYLDKEILVTN